LPGGGTIILGLDERVGFRPVGLADPQAVKQGLAAKARERRIGFPFASGAAAQLVRFIDDCGSAAPLTMPDD